jgi:creatinine amidohydrolase
VTTPLRIKEMTPAAIIEAAKAVPRLLIPVGTCEQHGAHLPVGSDTIVVERLADDLSAELRVLIAPTIEFGVNDGLSSMFPGGASVRRKTLRRWLNDLLGDWERLEIARMIMLTMNGFAPHQEALATVVSRQAKIRVLDILAMDFGALIEHPDDPVHGGEVDTSLVMHVRPDLVRMDAAADYILPERYLRRYRRGSAIASKSDNVSGSIGRPSSATPEKGRLLYEFIRNEARRVVTNAEPAKG